MPSIRHALPSACLLAALAATTAGADTPAPLTPTQFSFPAAALGPADAASAGTGFADRWLGEEPFDNPAAAPGRSLRVTPQLARTSRQDLHASNRDVDDGGPAFDFAGARLSLPAGRWTVHAWGSQPVLRVDNIGYTVGRSAPASGSPAAVVLDGTARELRGGLGVSVPGFGGRVGVAAEIASRSDRYERNEVSGSPDAGRTAAEFSGTAFGASAGGRWERTPAELWGWTAGAAARWTGALEVEGTSTAELVSGTATQSFSASRAGGLEGGASCRVTVGRGARVIAAVGGGTAREWEGFGLTPGATAEWRVGLDLRDPLEPWIVRFGVGQELQPGTPEPRVGHVAVGFGWSDEEFGASLAVIRRSFERNGLPTAHDDRVLVSLELGF